MNVNEMAINKRTALRMFWDAGHISEEQLIAASKNLDNMPQPSKGYWYAKDVSKAIGKLL